MEYDGIPKINKEYFCRKEYLVSQEELTLLLYGIAHIEDVEWVESIYLKYMFHDNKWIAFAAISSLGDMARISKFHNKHNVINKLKQLEKRNDEYKYRIENTLSDINIFEV